MYLLSRVQVKFYVCFIQVAPLYLAARTLNARQTQLPHLSFISIYGDQENSEWVHISSWIKHVNGSL